MATARRWLPIVAGVAVLVVFIGIGAIALSVAYFSENTTIERDIETTRATPRSRRPRADFADLAAGGRVRRAAPPALRRGHRQPQEPGHGDHRARDGVGSRRAGARHRRAADVAASAEVGPDRVRHLRERPGRPRGAAGSGRPRALRPGGALRRRRRRRANASSFRHSSRPGARSPVRSVRRGRRRRLARLLHCSLLPAACDGEYGDACQAAERDRRCLGRGRTRRQPGRGAAPRRLEQRRLRHRLPRRRARRRRRCARRTGVRVPAAPRLPLRRPRLRQRRRPA